MRHTDIDLKTENEDDGDDDGDNDDDDYAKNDDETVRTSSSVVNRRPSDKTDKVFFLFGFAFVIFRFHNDKQMLRIDVSRMVS